jgi:hypothetical protein
VWLRTAIIAARQTARGLVARCDRRSDKQQGVGLRAAIIAATSSKGCGCAQRSSQRQAARDVVACSDHRSATSSKGWGCVQRSSQRGQRRVWFRAAIIEVRQAARSGVARSDHRSAASSDGYGFAQRSSQRDKQQGARFRAALVRCAKLSPIPLSRGSGCSGGCPGRSVRRRRHGRHATRRRATSASGHHAVPRQAGDRRNRDARAAMCP